MKHKYRTSRESILLRLLKRKQEHFKTAITALNNCVAFESGALCDCPGSNPPFIPTHSSLPSAPALDSFKEYRPPSREGFVYTSLTSGFDVPGKEAVSMGKESYYTLGVHSPCSLGPRANPDSSTQENTVEACGGSTGSSQSPPGLLRCTATAGAWCTPPGDAFLRVQKGRGSAVGGDGRDGQNALTGQGKVCGSKSGLNL